MFQRIVLTLCVGVTISLLSGCAQEMVTRQHYDMIHEGKSNKLEVEKTLGNTYVDRGDHWEYEEMDRGLSVVFHFDDKGYVTHKQWRDANTGEWDGAGPNINENPEGKQISGSTGAQTVKEN